GRQGHGGSRDARDESAQRQPALAPDGQRHQRRALHRRDAGAAGDLHGHRAAPAARPDRAADRGPVEHARGAVHRRRDRRPAADDGEAAQPARPLRGAGDPRGHHRDHLQSQPSPGKADAGRHRRRQVGALRGGDVRARRTQAGQRRPGRTARRTGGPVSNQPPLADRFPNRPRPSRAGRLKALGLAILVHLGLLAMLVVGVSWKSSEPPPVIAELWTPAPAVDAPQPVPQPQPAPPPPPKPEPQPEPPPPQPDPQIAIEKARREAEEKRKAEEARRAEEERKRKLAEEEKRKAEEERQRRLAEERRRKAEEERQMKLAEERKRKADEERKRKLAEEQKRKAAEQARREREEAERQRAAYLESLRQAAAGSETGAPGGAPAGGASGARASAGGTGMDAGYQARVAAAIRNATHYVIPA